MSSVGEAEMASFQKQLDPFSRLSIFIREF